MVGFIVYDLIFLALFTLFVIIFLYTRKHNLQRQGILYLYRTQLGVRFIDKFAKRFKNILKPLQYVILVSGYSLMVGILWLLGRTVYLYLTTPIANVIRAPPIAPLIPYFPKIFGLESFFPPLYFAYFIIALAVVAISHEFAHGVYFRFHKLRIVSTGFAFLGPILGAFVEQDEKEFEKAKKFPQLVILAAGTFANVLMTLIFGIILWLFFVNSFVASGIMFNTYAISEVGVNELNVLELADFDENLIEVELNGYKYFAGAESLNNAKENGIDKIFVYDDSPALRNQIKGAITEINGEKIDSYEKLANVIDSYNPGDEVNIKTVTLEPGRGTIDESFEYDIEFSERDGKAFLGVGFSPLNTNGFIGWFYENVIAKIKNPFVYYESDLGDLGWFIYYLLWWIVVIDILVALFNMLPLGILDGGRYFYLTIWSLTGSEKIGKKAFKFVTWAILGVVILLMLRWVLIFF